MGIKMGTALDGANVAWEADSYAKGKGKEPLRCVSCAASVTHQSAHARERDDKPVLVPAYFRLLPHMHHADDCKHAVAKALKTIAKDSHGLIESLRDKKYRLRLMMIKDALSAIGGNIAESRGSSRASSSRTFERSSSKLPAYINSAQRVLQLRAMCDEDAEIAEHLELLFEGNTVVPWGQFYYEAERYLDAYHAALHNTVQHPIAIHGVVDSIRFVNGKYGPTNVLNLITPKSIKDANDPKNGIRVQASCWSKDGDWFDGFVPGAEIVLLGMFKATAGTPQPSTQPGKYRFDTFSTHKMSITLSVRAQVAPVPVK